MRRFNLTAKPSATETYQKQSSVKNICCFNLTAKPSATETLPVFSKPTFASFNLTAKPSATETPSSVTRILNEEGLQSYC